MNFDGEYLFDERSVAFVCRRCGGLVAEIGQALHTWNHRLLTGVRASDLGPRPTLG